MVVPGVGPAKAIVPALIVVLLAASCSTKQTSPVQTCDSDGVDLVAFASDRGHHGQYDIYLYDIDGVGYRLLRNLNSSVAGDSSPALSPDNQLIAFVSTRGATGSDIFLYQRSVCGFVNTPGLNTAGDETEPAFSGNISRLAFVRDTTNPGGLHRRIRVLDATGSALALVALPGLDTLAAFDDWSPAPDQTADSLVFDSDREGSPHLYLYRRSRGIDSLLFVRGADGIDVEPAVTPDLHFLCFASNRSSGLGGFDLYLYDLRTHAQVSLPAGVNTSGDERHPALNASGTVIAYQSQTSVSSPWNVRYVFLGTSPPAISTIGRIDSTASDIQPSIVFP
jgi:Tol biopolymer transport system component